MKTYNWLHYKEGQPSKIHGIGIFAKCFIPKGSIIKIPLLGFNSFAGSGGVNHSCDPTITPINDNFDMLAVRDIQRGEELTNNYWPLNKEGCNCSKCAQCDAINKDGVYSGFHFLFKINQLVRLSIERIETLLLLK